MSVFQQDDYKSALISALNARKREGRRINLSQLAAACRIQKTYLSRVLKRDAHFNPDQLHLACKFLGLKAKEREFIFLLHAMERSELPDRKEALLAQVRKIQAKIQGTENYIQTEAIQSEPAKFLQYHLNPALQLIHIFLTIPKYAKNVRLLEDQLSLTKEELARHLGLLAEMGVISWRRSEWGVNQETIHLPQDSEIFPFYRLAMRTKLLEKVQRGLGPKDYSFSAFFSADEATRQIIRERFMEFLQSIAPLIKKAPANGVFQMNFDLVGWS